jgi:hypothetical protein
MREEIEHSAMLIEWLRRNNRDFGRVLKAYLFTTAPITSVEAEETAETGDGAAAQRSPAASRVAIGSLKGT